MLLLLGSSIAVGEERFNFKKDDLEFAKDLAEKSRQMTLPQMKAKWFELQNMLGMLGTSEEKDTQDNESLPDFDSEQENGTSFRIFVSSSMSKNLLKSYASRAKKYGAVLVFKGLPGGSWCKLSELVVEISGDRPELIAMQIDDEVFAQFDIKEVPSFVLSKTEDIFAENPKVTFDKVTGAIGIRRALEIFKGEGQLKDIANSKLEQGRHDE